MPQRSDIMRGSPGWERLGNGIPENVAPTELRRVLHDYSNVIMVIADALNRSIDAQDLAKEDVQLALAAARQLVADAKQVSDEEHVRIHQRIDRRAEAHDELRDELFNPKDGLFAAMVEKQRAYTDTKTGRMTGVLLVVLGGVVTSSIMLAIQMGAGR